MEIANLSRLVEQGAGLTLGQENTVNELMKQKEELTQERDALLQQVVGYRNEIGDSNERVKALEVEKSAKDSEIAELAEQIARLKSDAERELRRKERLEKDAKDMKIMLEKKQEEVRQKQLAVNQGEEELGRQALKLRELEFQAQKAHKENDALSQKTQRLQQELEEQINTNNQLLTENNQRQIELKTKDDEIAAVNMT